MGLFVVLPTKKKDKNKYITNLHKATTKVVCVCSIHTLHPTYQSIHNSSLLTSIDCFAHFSLRKTVLVQMSGQTLDVAYFKVCLCLSGRVCM